MRLVTCFSIIILGISSVLGTESPTPPFDNKNSTISAGRTSPNKRGHPERHRLHQKMSKKIIKDTLERRTSYHGKGTYFTPGQCACGGYATSSDKIVAISSNIFNGGKNCNKRVTITSGGKTTSAIVKDSCPGCNDSDLDMSQATFDELGSESQGVLDISWYFN